MSQTVCSTTHLFHYLLNENEDTLQSMLANGLRPLSYFPDSPRWKQLQEHAPSMFNWIYENFAQPIIQKPYQNSGIFITPIDFYKMEETWLHDKARIAVPKDLIDPEWAAITYELEGQRISLPFTDESLTLITDIWDEQHVREWFGKDSSKVFYYVPQIVTYQPDGIAITGDFIQKPKVKA